MILGGQPGPAYLWRAQKIAVCSWKACARGHVDGTGSGQAEYRKNGAPINDGVARRVGARSDERKQEAAAHTCQQRLSICRG